MEGRETNYSELTVKGFLAEVLHDGLEMGAPMKIESIDEYAINISMRSAQMYYQYDFDESDGVIGLKGGTSEIVIKVDTIDYIWKYHDGSYQIGFTIPVPDLTLVYI